MERSTVKLLEDLVALLISFILPESASLVKRRALTTKMAYSSFLAPPTLFFARHLSLVTVFWAGALPAEAVRCKLSVGHEIKTEIPVQALRSLRTKTIRCYHPEVIYEWNPGKAASNLRRHGVPALTMGSRPS